MPWWICLLEESWEVSEEERWFGCFCLFGICCCCSDDGGGGSGGGGGGCGGGGGEPPFNQDPCVLVCFKQHLQHTSVVRFI